MSSTLSMKGMGPRPRKNAARNTIRLSRGSRPRWSAVFSDPSSSGTSVEWSGVTVVVVLEPGPQSPHSSVRRKKMATPSMETQTYSKEQYSTEQYSTVQTQTRSWEMMRSTRRPARSIHRVVAREPSTCTAPSSIVLEQAPREVPALCNAVQYSTIQYSTGAQGGHTATVSTLLYPDIATFMMVVL